MSNTDLINAYFGNEMNQAERQEFEVKLQKDPELKKEFDFQKDIVNGIKETRRLELKSLLDKVPVGGSSVGGSTAAIKLLSGVAIIGLVTIGAIYMWPETQEGDINAKEQISLNTPIEEQPIEQRVQEPINEVSDHETEDIEVETPIKNRTNKPVGSAKPSGEISKPEIHKPDMGPTFDTQDDITDSLQAPGGSLITRSYSDHNALDVEIDDSSKKHSFHYQFKNGKLFLFGSFDKGLYEIIEINSNGDKTLFLFYKYNFYTLNINQEIITALEPVKDQALIRNLTTARGEG